MRILLSTFWQVNILNIFYVSFFKYIVQNYQLFLEEIGNGWWKHEGRESAFHK